MTTYHCSAGYVVSSGATWRCNLIAGHVGAHDNGGTTWADDTTTPGPSRLQTAAVNLIGSPDAWEAIFNKVHDDVRAEGSAQGVDGITCKELADTAVFAVHAVLKGWVGQIDVPADTGDSS